VQWIWQLTITARRYD